MFPKTKSGEKEHRKHKRQMEITIAIEEILNIVRKDSCTRRNVNILEFGSGSGFQIPYLKSIGNVVASDIYTSDDIKNFLLDEVRQINNEYIKENKEEIAKCRAGRECSRSKLYTLVSDNTADINEALIMQKLKEIYDNADLIAKEA